MKTRKGGNPNWVKGQSGNPNGRPSEGMSFVAQLKAGLAKCEKEEGISLIDHALKQAYKDNVLCSAILKKILPDKMDLGDTVVDRIILIRSSKDKSNDDDTAK